MNMPADIMQNCNVPQFIGPPNLVFRFTKSNKCWHTFAFRVSLEKYCCRISNNWTEVVRRINSNVEQKLFEIRTVSKSTTFTLLYRTISEIIYFFAEMQKNFVPSRNSHSFQICLWENISKAFKYEIKVFHIQIDKYLRFLSGLPDSVFVVFCSNK